MNKQNKKEEKQEKEEEKNNHNWKQSEFLNKPTWCGLCSSFIYGITKDQQNACVCLYCGIISHKKCCTDNFKKCNHNNNNSSNNNNNINNSIVSLSSSSSDNNNNTTILSNQIDSNNTSNTTNTTNNSNHNYDRLIVVGIRGARKLKITQTIGDQDPYLRIWTSCDRENKIRTKTYVDGGTLAIWNETHELRIDSSIENTYICVEVKNENDILSDALIGRLKIACSEIPETPFEAWYQIQDEDGHIAGEVQLVLSYKHPKQRKSVLSEGLRAQIRSRSILQTLENSEKPSSSRFSNVASQATSVQNAKNKFRSKIDTQLSPENSPSIHTSDEPIESTSSPSSPSKQSINSSKSPLPDGWEERQTPNGKVFYVDHINKKTTWSRPTSSPSSTST